MKREILEEVQSVYSNIKETKIKLHLPEIHIEFQTRLRAMGERWGFNTQLEYPVDDPKGRIDVAWFKNGESRPHAIFEIDSEVRGRSLEKLRFSEADFKYWVYYGTRPFPQSYYKIYSNINIIILPPFRTRNKIRVEFYIREELYMKMMEEKLKGRLSLGAFIIKRLKIPE